MSKNPDNLQTDLTMIGLEPEEARLFVALCEKQFSTALALSREFKLPRTRVYRILDRLVSKGFVISMEGELGTVFQAVEPMQLNKIVAEKELELAKLTLAVDSLMPRLKKLKGNLEEDSRISYYCGLAGLRQAFTNVSGSKSVSMLLMQDPATYVGKQFINKLSELWCAARGSEGCRLKMLVANGLQLSGYTGFMHAEIKALGSASLKLDYDVIIHDSAYVLLSSRGGGVMAIEIHSPDLVNIQQQIFSGLWLATPT